MGIAIAILVNILNPEIIIMVGGITNEGDKLLSPLKELFSRAMSSHLADLKIILEH